MIIITLTVTIIIDYNDKYYVKYSENYIHVYYAKYNNSDNYNANHVPFILSACRLFKNVKLFKVRGFWLAGNVFIIHSAEMNTLKHNCTTVSLLLELL